MLLKAGEIMGGVFLLLGRLLGVSVIVLLSACASYSGRTLENGVSTLPEVVATLGEPAMRWKDDDGREQLAYPRGPYGTQTFMALMSADGRLERIEGVLEYLGVMPPYDKTEKRWQQPQLQYFCGGKSKIEKRRKSKDWLKEHGLYLTGKYVGCKDAEDVISSQLHAFAYLRGIKHRPTLLHYFRSSP